MTKAHETNSRQPTISDVWVRLTVMRQHIEGMQKDIAALNLEAHGHDDMLREIQSAIGELSTTLDDHGDQLYWILREMRRPWWKKILGVRA